MKVIWSIHFIRTKSIQMKIGNSFREVTTNVIMCKQIHGVTSWQLQSSFDNEFTQMTKYWLFGQLISLGPISIQRKMTKSTVICCVTTHVIMCKQIHGVTSWQLQSSSDNEFTQMTKYWLFGQQISLGPISIQRKMSKSTLIGCVTIHEWWLTNPLNHCLTNILWIWWRIYINDQVKVICVTHFIGSNKYWRENVKKYRYLLSQNTHDHVWTNPWNHSLKLVALNCSRFDSNHLILVFWSTHFIGANRYSKENMKKYRDLLWHDTNDMSKQFHVITSWHMGSSFVNYSTQMTKYFSKGNSSHWSQYVFKSICEKLPWSTVSHYMWCWLSNLLNYCLTLRFWIWWQI